MRILVVSQYFWPETFRINEIVADLAARGHEVTVLTGPPNYPSGDVFPEYRSAPASFARFHGADVIRVPMVPRGKNKLSLLINYLAFVLSGLTVGAWRLAGRQFDAILVCQLSPITSALPALWQRRAKRAPLAMWILDLWPETLPAVGALNSPRALRWASRLVSFIYNRCDCILVQSRAFLPSIEKHASNGARVRYLPAWAEQTFETSLDLVALAPELAPFGGTFNVMFAGNIGEAQDFPTILEAANLLRARADIRWLIVGDGRAAEAVRTEIAARQLGDCVIMLGRHPLERMPSFFKGASALLVALKSGPVLAMTIPGKVQSYMRSGIPIIAVLDGEGARIIGEAGAGLVCPSGDPAKLARVVAELADQPAEARARMGAAASAYCQREFDRDQLLSQLNGWLLELADEGARNGTPPRLSPHDPTTAGPVQQPPPYVVANSPAVERHQVT